MYLGIDGGGTGCRARLVDGAGRTLGEGRAGPANLGLGATAAVVSISAAAAAALIAARLEASAASGVVVGLGLAGANVPSLAEAFLAERLPFAAVALASDAVTACIGAHSGKDGAILIVGTGSQGLARKDGRTATIGGWGFAIGDGGSGAVLGRHLVRAAVRACDGLEPASRLTEAVMAGIGGGPEAAVAWARTATPRDYAAFAPMLFAAAGEGDDTAGRIVRTGAVDVDAHLDALRRIGTDRIAMVGGLALAYRPWVDRRFAGILVEAEGDAMAGAIHLARMQDAEPASC